jgi:hypothetical protein
LYKSRVAQPASWRAVGFVLQKPARHRAQGIGQKGHGQRRKIGPLVQGWRHRRLYEPLVLACHSQQPQVSLGPGQTGSQRMIGGRPFTADHPA